MFFFLRSVCLKQITVKRKGDSSSEMFQGVSNKSSAISTPPARSHVFLFKTQHPIHPFPGSEKKKFAVFVFLFPGNLYHKTYAPRSDDLSCQCEFK